MHLRSWSAEDLPCLQVLTRALQLHPREPRLWSHAAGFEFEDHHNPAAARLLLQRGLRICPNSTHLWLENFRLELLYAHQLRTRRQVLGLQACPHFHSTTIDLTPFQYQVFLWFMLTLLHAGWSPARSRTQQLLPDF